MFRGKACAFTTAKNVGKTFTPSIAELLQNYLQPVSIAGHSSLITQTTDLIQNVHVVQFLLAACKMVIKFNPLLSFHIILILRWRSSATEHDKTNMYMFAYFNEIEYLMSSKELTSLVVYGVLPCIYSMIKQAWN